MLNNKFLSVYRSSCICRIPTLTYCKIVLSMCVAMCMCIPCNIYIALGARGLRESSLKMCPKTHQIAQLTKNLRSIYTPIPLNIVCAVIHLDDFKMTGVIVNMFFGAEIFWRGVQIFLGGGGWKICRVGWEIWGGGWEISGGGWEIFERGWDFFGRGWEFFGRGWDFSGGSEIFFGRGSDFFGKGWDFFGRVEKF